MRILFLISLLLLSSLSYALPFSIVTKSGTNLPTRVHPNSTVIAYYTITNNTLEQRNNNYIKYLPPNVSQITSDNTFSDSCGATFNLAKNGTAGDSCTLELSISGPVNGNDPNPRHHLFACFPGGVSCSGTSDSLNISAITTPVYAYVTNNGGNSVSYCIVNDDGTFGTCQTTGGGFHTPSGLAINAAGTFAYIPNQDASPANISICAIQSDGSFGTCTQSTASGLLSSPTDVAINPAGTVLYISNLNGGIGNIGGVVSCSINQDGSLGTCQLNSSSSFDQPAGVVVNASNSFCYVANYVSSTVSYCTIANDGGLNSCATTGSLFHASNGIAINPAGNFAYVSDKNDNEITYCSIQSNGTLTNCAVTNPQFDTPFFIKFTANGHNVYVTNTGNNTVSYCPVNADGSIGTCVTTGTGFNKPRGIALTP